MSNNSNTPESYEVNAQAGDAGLLATERASTYDVLKEVSGDWLRVLDSPETVKEFTVSEFEALDRSFLRCAYIVAKIDETHLYLNFNQTSTAKLLAETFGIAEPMVSRYRTAFPFASAICDEFPKVRLKESQMRKLRSVVKRRFPSLNDRQLVKKGLEIYSALYAEKNGRVTAKDIATACASLGAKPKSQAPKLPKVKPQHKKPARPQDSSSDITVPRDQPGLHIPEDIQDELVGLLSALLLSDHLDEAIKQHAKAVFAKIDIVVPDDELDSAENPFAEIDEDEGASPDLGEFQMDDTDQEPPEDLLEELLTEGTDK